MGILASQNPEEKGAISDDGFEMGRISPGGTAQLLFTTLEIGLLAALIYLALRTLAFGPAWFRIASLTVGGTVVFGALLIDDGGVDFTLLDPDWLPVILFLAIPLIYVPLAALLIEHWLRPTSWFRTADIRKVAAVVVVWIGPLFWLPAVWLVGTYVVRTIGSRMSKSARGAAAWLARLGFGVLGLLAFLALIGDIDAVT